MHGMCFAMLTPILYISGCRKIHAVARGKGFAHVLMVCSVALDYVYRTYSACGKAYGATHERHYQFCHFHGVCREEVRRCPYASMWGSKWGDCSQMVHCVLNHMLIPWVSEVLYYCDYLEFSNICMFLTSFMLIFVFSVLNWLSNSKVPRDP